MKPTDYKKLLLLLTMGLLLHACAHGPYKGRVVDEHTGEPLAGVVAVGQWTYSLPTPAGATTECRDAREAVSDGKGEFEIPEVSWGTFSISVYKVGYQRVQCPWESLQRWGGCMTEPAQWDGDRAIILLNKVAKSRMGYEGRPPSGGCGRKDGKPLAEYMKAHEDYRRALGLKH